MADARVHYGGVLKRLPRNTLLSGHNTNADATNLYTPFHLLISVLAEPAAAASRWGYRYAALGELSGSSPVLMCARTTTHAEPSLRPAAGESLVFHLYGVES